MTVIINELELLKPRVLFSGVLNEDEDTTSRSSTGSPALRQPDSPSEDSISSVGATKHALPLWKRAASKLKWIIPSFMNSNTTTPSNNTAATAPPIEIKGICRASPSPLKLPPRSPQKFGLCNGLGQQHKHGMADLGHYAIQASKGMSATFKDESRQWRSWGSSMLEATLIMFFVWCITFAVGLCCAALIILGYPILGFLILFCTCAILVVALIGYVRLIWGQKPQSDLDGKEKLQLDMSTNVKKQY